MAKGKRKHNFSLTRRWLFQTATIVIAMLLIVCLGIAFTIHTYYYSSVDRRIKFYSENQVERYFENYNLNSSSFEVGAKNFVSDFSDKSSVEVRVVNGMGKVIISSSGFAVKEKSDIPELKPALSDPSSGARWTGRLDSGEHVTALTRAITDTNGTPIGAVRFMISLEEVDAQLNSWYLIVLSVFIFLVLLILISGAVFINSIVKPIREINDTATLIAEGNYDARIDHYLYNDEVGNLCDTINNMAEKIKVSDKIRNDFISTVSHELRTPLTAIKGWGEMLKELDGEDRELSRRGTEVIINESERLSQLVEELLDFSRMQNGNMTLRLEKIDVLAELDETIFVFKERSKRDGIELTYSVPDVPVPMQADPNRIKQVFVNILDNAFKYTNKGGTVNVEAVIGDKTLTITVSDTGCGISAEDLPNVKKKFYKANIQVRGSGIGLAVVDEIIKLHNGSFEISSELGVGTTVSVVLPVEKAVSEHPAPIIEEVTVVNNE